MTLDDLQIEIHQKMLDLRNVEALLAQFNFEILWKAEKDESRQRLIKWAMEGEKVLIEDWIKNHPSLDLGELSVNRLKAIAKKRHVTNYSRLNREELIITLGNLR